MKTQNINPELLKRFYANIYKKITCSTPKRISIESDDIIVYEDDALIFLDELKELEKYFNDKIIAIYPQPHSTLRIVIQDNR